MAKIASLENNINDLHAKIASYIKESNWGDARAASEILVTLQVALEHAWNALYTSARLLELQNTIKITNEYFKKTDDGLDFGKPI